MIDRKYIETYTNWRSSATTEQVIQKVDVVINAQINSLKDDTLVGAAKAHWVRHGVELYRNALMNQATLEDLNRMTAQTEEAVTYGAAGIVADDLFTNKGDKQ